MNGMTVPNMSQAHAVGACPILLALRVTFVQQGHLDLYNQPEKLSDGCLLAVHLCYFMSMIL